VTQLDVFDEESALDYKEIHDRFAVLDVDVNDIDDVFQAIKSAMSSAGLSQNFLGFMQNLLCVQVNTESGVRSFLLACKMIRHIALHKEKIGRDTGILSRKFRI
jgi:hypothetical protein